MDMGKGTSIVEMASRGTDIIVAIVVANGIEAAVLEGTRAVSTILLREEQSRRPEASGMTHHIVF